MVIVITSVNDNVKEQRIDSNCMDFMLGGYWIKIVLMHLMTLKVFWTCTPVVYTQDVVMSEAQKSGGQIALTAPNGCGSLCVSLNSVVHYIYTYNTTWI